MPDLNPDDALLLIRCPSCGQRFKVGEDLRGRNVECGGCEHRFRINDDVIVRGRKFYPGERHNARLNRFQRVPLAVAPPVIGTPTVRYADPPDPTIFEPASPQRIMAGLLGGIVIAATALLLILGASRGGALDGVTTENRLLMACFCGLLGTMLLVYANPRARGKVIIMGLALSSGLAFLPFVFTEGSTSVPDQALETSLTGMPDAIAEPAPSESDQLADLRRSIGTDPLAAEINRLTAEGSPRRAVGLWLRDLREQNRFLIKDYILRATDADPQSHYYPRDNGNFLMVVTGITLSLDEVAAIAADLGSIENTYPEISVIEVKVNNENFIEGPIKKLTDKTNPEFYDLNKRELESIDLERVERAVKRLADAEPSVYRSDISRKLIDLLGTPEVTFKGDICRALMVWAEDFEQAGETALIQAREMLANGVNIPEDVIALIVKSKNPGAFPILDELWQQNPNRWESHYAEMGQAAENSVLSRFPSTTGSHRQSAVRLLGRVGAADSLQVLEAAKAGAEPELGVLLENSMRSIRSREGL